MVACPVEGKALELNGEFSYRLSGPVSSVRPSSGCLEALRSQLRKEGQKALSSGNGARVAEIDAHLEELEKELLRRADTKQDYDDILERLDGLRDTKQGLLLEDANNMGLQRRLNEIDSFLDAQQTDIEEYDEDLIRKLLGRVTVYDDHLTFEFKCGIEIDITV